MYTFTSRVRFSETDENGKLSLAGIMNYLQDCSVFHSEDVGNGTDMLKKRDRVWLLNSWQIIIKSVQDAVNTLKSGHRRTSLRERLASETSASKDKMGHSVL